MNYQVLAALCWALICMAVLNPVLSLALFVAGVALVWLARWAGRQTVKRGETKKPQ